MTRREWCVTLGKLVSPAFPQDAALALVDMLPALSHLPDALFNAASLREVASKKCRQSIPAFSEIIEALNEYRKTYAIDPTLRLAARPNHDLPDDRVQPPPEEVKAVSELLGSFFRELAENKVRAAEQHSVRKALELPDVTLKGEQLREARIKRGVYPRMAAE